MEFIAKAQNDNNAVLDIIKGWGSDILVTKGKIHRVQDLDGILVYDNGKIIGLGLYKINNPLTRIKKDCEIVLLETFIQNQGIGTQIIERIKEIAKTKKCRRLWLITSNENINAFRFYQKRGFHISNIYKNAMERSRKIKPEIPKMENGIAIRDEIEFEIKL